MSPEQLSGEAQGRKSCSRDEDLLGGLGRQGNRDSQDRAAGGGMGRSSGKGSVTVNSAWSLMRCCSTRSESVFYYITNTHPMSKPRVLGKEPEHVQTIKTAIMRRKRDAKTKLLNLRFYDFAFTNL